MKKIIHLHLLCFCLESFSQETEIEFPQDIDKKHELSMNALTLIISEWIDISCHYPNQ